MGTSSRPTRDGRDRWKWGKGQGKSLPGETSRYDARCRRSTMFDPSQAPPRPRGRLFGPEAFESRGRSRGPKLRDWAGPFWETDGVLAEPVGPSEAPRPNRGVPTARHRCRP